MSEICPSFIAQYSVYYESGTLELVIDYVDCFSTSNSVLCLSIIVTKIVMNVLCRIHIVHLNRRNAFETELRQFKESNSSFFFYLLFTVLKSSSNILSYTLILQSQNMVHSLALHFDEHSCRLPQSLQMLYSTIPISYTLESYMQSSITRRQTRTRLFSYGCRTGLTTVESRCCFD